MYLQQVTEWVFVLLNVYADSANCYYARMQVSVSAAGPTSSVMESRDEVASSYRRMGGFLRMVRAMATRCFSPPEIDKDTLLIRGEESCGV